MSAEAETSSERLSLPASSRSRSQGWSPLTALNASSEDEKQNAWCPSASNEVSTRVRTAWSLDTAIALSPLRTRLPHPRLKLFKDPLVLPNMTGPLRRIDCLQV